MTASEPGPRGQAHGAPWRRWLLPLAGAAGVIAVLTLRRGTPAGLTLSYSRFVTSVDAGMVRAVTINPAGQATGSLAGGQQFATTIPVALDDRSLGGRLAAHHVQVTATAGMPSSLLSVIIGLLPVLLIGGLLFFMLRGARRFSALSGPGGTSLTRAKTRVIDAERPATRFADVAGYAAVKAEVGEIVDYLRRPGHYSAAGARGPRGVLMAGPPGTGKTLLARAVAGEASVPFLSISGSSFVELFVGVGAARVRDLFDQARTRAPAIVFIDEIDALGARRDSALYGSDEREQTLNQLLAEMDGFERSEGVVVLAATNRPDALDPALRRPGRFDREVLVPLPSRAERQAILATHARGKNLAPDVDLGQVAAATPGFSGADLANLVNEAALTAVRAGRSQLTAADFADARDRVVLGARDRTVTLTLDELATVAVHEAGHALVAALSPHADPVSRVTVLGAGHALGLTEMLPADDRRLYGERYLTDTLAVRLAGRAAERLVRGEASTGATDDLASATALASQMVLEFGLSDVIGPVSYGPAMAAHAGLMTPGYSEHTQQLVDEQVAALLTRAEARARDLLGRHIDALNRLTAALLQQETISGDQVRDLINSATHTEPAATTTRISK